MSDNNTPRKAVPIKSPFLRNNQRSRSSSSHDLLSSLNTLDEKRSKDKDLLSKLPPSKSQNPLLGTPSFPVKLEKMPKSYSAGMLTTSFSSFFNGNTPKKALERRSVDLSNDPEPEDNSNPFEQYIPADEPAVPDKRFIEITPKKVVTAVFSNTISTKLPATPTKFRCVLVSCIEYQSYILPSIQDVTLFSDIRLLFIPQDRNIMLSAKVHGKVEHVPIPYAKIYRIQFIRREGDPSSEWYIDFVLTSTTLDLSAFQKYDEASRIQFQFDNQYCNHFTTLRLNLAKNCGMCSATIENTLLSILSDKKAVYFTDIRDKYGEFEQSKLSGDSSISTPARLTLKRTVPSMESLAASESLRLKRHKRDMDYYSSSAVFKESAVPSYERRTSTRLKGSPPKTTRKRDPESFTYVDPDFEDTDSVKLFSFPEGEIDSVLVTSHELERLEPGIWLNDTLIDFELKYLKAELDVNLQERIHIFSSFFYRRLSSAKMGTTKDSESKTGYELVKTWTRKINIFEKDFVVIPINENLHWYLAIICHPRNMLTEEDVIKEEEDTKDDSDVNQEDKDVDEKEVEISSQSSESSLIVYLDREPRENTRIFIFDSLGLTSRGKSGIVVRRLKDYLRLEASDKLNKITLKEACTGHVVKVPQQENYTDCGCFLLQFAEEFFKSIPAGIETQITERGNDLSDWFEPEVAQNRRKIMKMRVNQLAADFAAREALRVPDTEQVEHEDRSSDIEEIVL